jgi:hypothetical protein
MLLSLPGKKRGSVIIYGLADITLELQIEGLGK